ncbi:MAG: hypothetical protein ACM3OC_04745 [Deltaproteobacteria bacterium]
MNKRLLLLFFLLLSLTPFAGCPMIKTAGFPCPVIIMSKNIDWPGWQTHFYCGTVVAGICFIANILFAVFLTRLFIKIDLRGRSMVYALAFNAAVSFPVYFIDPYEDYKFVLLRSRAVNFSFNKAKGEV